MACPFAAKKSGSSHLLGVVPSPAAQTAFVPELSKAITFLSYIQSWGNFIFELGWSRPFQWCIACRGAPKKSCTSHQFTPYANWSVTRRFFHYFGVSYSFKRSTIRKLHAGLGVGQILTACDSRLKKSNNSHLFWLVRTCLNLSTIQRPCTLIVQCHFLHFWMVLFFSLTSYLAEIAFISSPDGELSNSMQLV